MIGGTRLAPQPLIPEPHSVLQVRLLPIIELDPPLVTSVVQRFADATDTLTDARFGDDLPTKMIFAPDVGFAASLHYMFFPRGTCQQFHWHPGGRHLLVLGDTALTVRHNPCDGATNPYANAIEDTVRPNVLAAIRFPSHMWHEFSSLGAEGLGVIAFSFHDSDDLISSSVTLMQELTTFWTPQP